MFLADWSGRRVAALAPPDRVRWTRGVVDFIDLGIGSSRSWIFNVADVAVTCGAVSLAWLLWQQDREESGEPEVQA